MHMALRLVGETNVNKRHARHRQFKPRCRVWRSTTGAVRPHKEDTHEENS